MASDVTKTDPLRNFKFRVRIDQPGFGLPTMGFASMSGVSIQNELIQYREGGWNTAPRKMVGQSDIAPISFNRGFLPFGDEMWNWQKQMYFYQWGQGLLSDPMAYRCEIAVDVFDHPVNKNVSIQAPGNPRLTIQFYNCWPGAFATSDLNASDNGILINQMTVHTEGFDMKFN